MQTFECASGARTNWEKTTGLRLGALRQDVGKSWIHLTGNKRSKEVTFGYRPEGALGDIEWLNCDAPEAVRYLGIFLGAEAAVDKKFEDTVLEKVRTRLRRIRAAGIPRTWAGRNNVIKNLAMSIAVFYITNQTCTTDFLDRSLDVLERDFNDFYEVTASCEERRAAGENTHSSTQVKRKATVQDHADGGTKALDVKSFVAALRMTWITRLLDPAPQIWKDCV